MQTKVCKTCGESKLITEYNKATWKETFQPYCKSCDSERKKEWYVKNKERQSVKAKKAYQAKLKADPEYHKKLYQANRDKILKRNKLQQVKYKDKINERNRGYRRLDKYRNRATTRARERKHERTLKDPDYPKKMYQKNKERIDRQGRRDEYNAKQRAFKSKYPDRYKNYVLSDWAKENRKVRNRAWSKMKSESDIEFRIAKNIRSRTRLALKKWDTKKCTSTERLLGCSISEFKNYFCNLFTEGMTWELFMKGEIHIDHIKPCCRFDLSEPEQQTACFHYSNLQPLWKLDNFIKGKKYQEAA